MARVVHFEIPADDPERAVRFYEDAFGWKIQKWDGPMDYWMVTTGEDSEMGINGGILKRDAGQVTRNTIGVASLDDATAKVESGGGKVLMPKHAIPGVGYLALCADTEGNVFGVLQPDMSAG